MSEGFRKVRYTIKVAHTAQFRDVHTNLNDPLLPGYHRPYSERVRPETFGPPILTYAPVHRSRESPLVSAATRKKWVVTRRAEGSAVPGVPS